MGVVPPDRTAVRRIDAAHPARKPVDLHGPVQPLPQLGVLDGDQLAKSFPLPAVLTPFRQPVRYPVPEVTAAPVGRHSGGLVQRFETSDECEQFELLTSNVWLAILDGQNPVPV